MYGFSGNYKSKRPINLGGTTDSKSKKDILLRAQLERQKRESERLRLQSAIKIQAFYRGRSSTRTQFQYLRLSFDSSSKKSLSALLLFYSPSKDRQRLCTICKDLMNNEEFLMNLLLSQDRKYLSFRFFSLIFNELSFSEKLLSSDQQLVSHMLEKLSASNDNILMDFILNVYISSRSFYHLSKFIKAHNDEMLNHASFRWAVNLSSTLFDLCIDKMIQNGVNDYMNHVFTIPDLFGKLINIQKHSVITQHSIKLLLACSDTNLSNEKDIISLLCNIIGLMEPELPKCDEYSLVKNF